MISIILILLFPFLSFFCLFFFGVYLGKKGSFYLSSTFMFITLFLSLIYFLKYLIFYTYAYVYFGKWIEVENLMINWSFIFDSLSLSMCFVINFISFIVHIYSYEYMNKDPHIIRFLLIYPVYFFYVSTSMFFQFCFNVSRLGRSRDMLFPAYFILVYT